MIQNKPNILFLLHIPPPVHGSSIVGETIFRSELINKSFDCRYINLLMSRTINETGALGLKKLIRLPGVYLRLIWCLLIFRPHLVYLALTATGAAFYRDIALVALIRLWGVRHIFHLHNKGFSEYSKKGCNASLYRFAFKRAKVILLSSYLYDDIKQFVKVDQVYICPNGIKPNQSDPILKFKDDDKTPTILFLSNLLESKGVYTLLDACFLLKSRNVKFKCIFVGGEADISCNVFHAKIKLLGLEEFVKYLGKKYGTEKEKIFTSVDIFAFPTYFETFGLVNLEAMQNSLPVVSSIEGGIPDIIDDNVTGYLISPRDFHALADRLETLINNPLLRIQMGKAGKKKYYENFTIDIFEKRFIEILTISLK